MSDQNCQDLGSELLSDGSNPLFNPPETPHLYSNETAIIDCDLRPGGKIPILANDGTGNFVPTGKLFELPMSGDLEVVSAELKDALETIKAMKSKEKSLEKKVLELEEECATGLTFIMNNFVSL